MSSFTFNAIIVDVGLPSEQNDAVEEDHMESSYTPQEEPDPTTANPPAEYPPHKEEKHDPSLLLTAIT